MNCCWFTFVWDVDQVSLTVLIEGFKLLVWGCTVQEGSIMQVGVGWSYREGKVCTKVGS